MDQTTFIALDRLREELYRHRELTQQRFDRIETTLTKVLETVSKSTPQKKSPSPWDERMKWGICMLIALAMANGWDLKIGLDMLVAASKLFGSR